MVGNNTIKEGLNKLIDYTLSKSEDELGDDERYNKAYKQIGECHELLEGLIPADKHEVLLKLDAAESELMVATGDFLYEAGFKDGIRMIRLLLLEAYI